MKRVDVYLKDVQYEEWKQLAESKGLTLSEFVKAMVDKALNERFLEDRMERLEKKVDGTFIEVDRELNMLWGYTGRLEDALKKLNRGERLTDSDFA
jgi:hypothetical protein